MKIAIWTNMPNHYQSAFHAALRARGVDLVVRYYYPGVPTDRIAMGWETGNALPEGSKFLLDNWTLETAIPDWKTRIHIMPGYGDRILWPVLDALIESKTPWAHWSEPSRPSIRRLFNWAIKRRYARKVNEHALGAFGIGAAALRDFVSWGMRREKLAMLPYSAPQYDLNTPPDSACQTFRNGQLAFLFAGSLCHRKGIDVLLKAFAKATSESRNVVLILVGNDSSHGRYLAMAEDLKISDRVLFRGPISPELLGSAFAACDVFVLPSRFDGWGVALNEAALMGRALIATTSVGAAEHMIEPGQNGFRVHAGDVRGLQAALQTYILRPELAHQHGERSLRVSQFFTPSQNCLRFQQGIQTWRAM